jgi:hypothetical protein
MPDMEISYDAPDDDLDDRLDLLEASMTATEFFHSVEDFDSKRVDGFWELLPDTVLEILNPNDRNKSG